ncbi:MAG: hypothetical protein IKU76_07475 [Bacteroidaceae bacterium]|nr:hypothetical protein [Bacteroidaceae bacterium]
MKKTILSIVAICSMLLNANAQKVSAFEHLDFSITAGTTGIGFDLATPISEKFRLRAGFSFVPEFDTKMNFGIQGRKMDDNGNWVTTKFDSMADRFSDFTGITINDNVDMIGQPNFYNGNLLVDFFPIKNSDFYITAGFYFGKSKIASACNSIEDMASLLGVSMYNRIYEKVENYEPIIGDDIYLTPELEQKILDNGRLGIHMGDKVATGEPYMMEPDENSTVKANIFVNSFKPYLGVGYGGKLTKKNDALRISFDAGMLFWGGTPEIVTHDGTDLAKDVENIGGKVGDYVSLVESLKVYPVLKLSISYRIF